MKTVRAYRKKYRRNSEPSDNTIRSLVKNFFEYGSVATRQRPIRSRPRRSDKVVEAVRDSVADNPNVSYRRRSSVSRFETGTLHTQRQQQYVRENGCARSAVRLLFAAVL